MHIRRQLLAAGLLSAFSLATPHGALPYVAPAQAQAPLSSSAVTSTVYLPFLAGGAARDLSISSVQIIQGIAQSPAYAVHIAGRPTLLRVFVTLSGADRVDGISTHLSHWVDGDLQGTLLTSAQTLPATASPGDLSHTFNFNLPADWLTEGSEYVVELDVTNALAETDEANNRYPAAGSQSFDFVNVPTLDVVIVPVTYKGITPPLDDLSYLTWMPERVLPVARINYTVRPTPFVFEGDLRSGSGWNALLVAVDTVRAAEDPTWNKVYYGLVDSIAADGCSGGCYTGLGYVNSPDRTLYKSAVGFAGFAGNRQAASTTLTHEMGHNFGRRHAPCAGPGNVDTTYPYASGQIGQWGYDVSTGALLSPGYKDFMSYCGPEWTSDYTFHGIAQSWSWLDVNYAPGANASAETLVIIGRLAPDGSLYVEPIFHGEPAPQVASTAPTHRVELVDGKGRVLASVPFVLSEIILDQSDGGEAASTGHSHAAHTGAQPASFRVQVEPLPGLAGLRVYHGSELLFERTVSGPAPAFEALDLSTSVHADGRVSFSAEPGAAGLRYRVRYSPDGGATWHLLALDAASPKADVPAVLRTGATEPLVEIQASDGVRSVLQVLTLRSP